MTTAQRVRIYFWLTALIKQHGSIKLTAINERWTTHELSGKCPFDRNTFRSYLNDIEEVEKPSVFDPRGQAMLTLTGKI
jgi:hypothetical protein